VTRLFSAILIFLAIPFASRAQELKKITFDKDTTIFVRYSKGAFLVSVKKGDRFFIRDFGKNSFSLVFGEDQKLMHSSVWNKTITPVPDAKIKEYMVAHGNAFLKKHGTDTVRIASEPPARKDRKPQNISIYSAVNNRVEINAAPDKGTYVNADHEQFFIVKIGTWPSFLFYLPEPTATSTISTDTTINVKPNPPSYYDDSINTCNHFLTLDDTCKRSPEEIRKYLKDNKYRLPENVIYSISQSLGYNKEKCQSPIPVLLIVFGGFLGLLLIIFVVMWRFNKTLVASLWQKIYKTHQGGNNPGQIILRFPDKDISLKAFFQIVINNHFKNHPDIKKPEDLISVALNQNHAVLDPIIETFKYNHPNYKKLPDNHIIQKIWETSTLYFPFFQGKGFSFSLDEEQIPELTESSSPGMSMYMERETITHLREQLNETERHRTELTVKLQKIEEEIKNKNIKPDENPNFVKESNLRMTKHEVQLKQLMELVTHMSAEFIKTEAENKRILKDRAHLDQRLSLLETEIKQLSDLRNRLDHDFEVEFRRIQEISFKMEYHLNRNNS
jgi:hypothetical protein